MIVVDASAAVLAFANDADARRSLATEVVLVAHLADAEVASALRAQVRRGSLREDHAWLALDRWMRLGLRRVAVVGLLPRVWELRDDLTAYDATYVALADAHRCELVTADARIAQAPGPACAITVVRA